MRILQVHKYLYRKAGAEAYMLDLAQLLAENGHEVALWGTNAQSMIHDSRFMIQESLLVEYLNFDKRDGLWQDIRKVGHMIWSTEAAEKFDDLLDIFAPDVIHLHNIYHHISPSILPVAARHQIPVMMTVHDYKLINPNYSLFDHGEICERDGLRAVAHRCIKNSYLATAADVIEMKIHRAMRVYERYIARFIVPTIFVKEKLVEKGLDEKKIEVVPLPIAPSPVLPSLDSSRRGGRTSSPVGRGIANHPSIRGRGEGEGYILYAGRLTQEKGIYIVLELAKRLPEIKFKIAGDGPEREEIKNKISKIKNVELLGFVEKERLQALIAGARIILVPSLWYEVSPLAVLEAMAQGKVVLASEIGALTNLIKDGKTGFLVRGANNESSANLRISNSQIRKFESHSQFVPQWVDMIQKIYYNETLLKKVGQNAKAYVEHVHDPDKHYEKIMEIYEDAISKIKNKKSNTQT